MSGNLADLPSPGAAGARDDSRANVWLLEFWRILVARRQVVLTCLAAVVASTLLLTLLMKPEYEATATLQIEALGADVLNFKDVVSTDLTQGGYWKFYQTQYKLLRSRAVLQMAVDETDLTHRPELLARRRSPVERLVGWLRARTAGAAPEPDRNAEALTFLEDNISIRPVRDSQLVDVSFTSESPLLARDLANAVTEAFVDFNFESRYGTTRAAREFLTKEVARVQEEIARLEGQLQDYGDSKDILAASDGTHDVSQQALADLSRRHIDARARLAVAEARYEAVREARPEALPDVLNSPLISNLKQQHAEVERRHTQMAEKFRPDWPALVQLREELSQSRQRLDLEAETIARQVREVAHADYVRARAEAENLGRQVAKQKAEVQRVQRDAIEYSSLKADIATRRGVLNDLVARQSETATSERLRDRRTGNLKVVDPAEIPKQPVRPNKILNVLLAIVLGSVAGVAMAFLLEHLDNTVKDGQDVERLTGLPLLGHVPVFEATTLAGAAENLRGVPAVVDLACHLDPQSPFAESFKTVRTSLLLASSEHPPRRILVASCQPREGKSALSANLAIALTQLGRRVLLVDGDLRLGRLHKILGVPNTIGLSSYLSGNASVEEVVRDTQVPGLQVVLSGPIPPNPSELLGSPLLETLLDRLGRDRFVDYVVFDSSPLLYVADAIILASRLDATILVARAGETTREALSRGYARLRQSRARVIGVVLNGCTHNTDDYYHGRYRDREEVDRQAVLASARPAPAPGRRRGRWAGQA